MLVGGTPRFESGLSRASSAAEPGLFPDARTTALVPRDSYRSEFVEGTNERLEPYIIVPKEETKEVGKGRLLERLARLNILVNSEIPLIKGFTAIMNQESKQKLEEAGFKAIPDQDGRFLPPEPWEREPEEATDSSGREVVGPRPALTEPRFLTALTQQYTGRGIGIAVVDTGIYPHPDFTYPQNRIVAFQDFVNDRTLPYDDNGHGTHVAGDAAGSGFLSRGIHRGTAPDARVVAVKVLDERGHGSTSRILQGINWVVENRERYNIRVINLSLGSYQPRGEDDPIRQAVEKAAEAGVVVVVSAGNRGPSLGSISAPGDSPSVITVGAVDDRNTPSTDDDRIPNFSSRGARGSSKPDLVAPGEAIIGPNAPGTPTEATARKYTAVNETLGWLDRMPDSQLVNVPFETLRLIGLKEASIRRFKQSPSSARIELNRLRETTDRLPMVQGNYTGMPGTSMAAPIVAGVVAQLLEANPFLTPDDVKEILRSTATPLDGYLPESQGAGVINPDGALQAAVKRLRNPEPNGQMRLPIFMSTQEDSRGPESAGSWSVALQETTP
ncbi:MAG: S8 family peptidase [Armatimonadetes bacterium]|nr:S8 family peptidase [Armatimonadota bacterium]